MKLTGSMVKFHTLVMLWLVVAPAFAVAEQSQCSFNTMTRFVGSILGDATHGDFDGDSDLDLAVVSSEVDAVLIFLNTGNGTFAAPINFAIGVDGETIACGDLDGDLDLDLVIGNSISNSVSVMLNNGDGTFAAGVNFAVNANGDLMANDLLLADFDNDDDLDLAVRNTIADPKVIVPGSLSFLINNGSGSFGPATTMDVGFFPFGIVDKDVDGDQDLDLYLLTTGAKEDSDSVLQVLENDGNGGFSVQSEIETVQAGTATMKFADVDGDSFEDLVLASRGSDFSVFYGTASGVYEPEVEFTFSGLAVDVELMDLDGDSDLEVILSSGRLDRVGVLLNNGNRTFSHVLFQSVGECAGDLMAGDFDGDQLDEFVVVAEEGMRVVSLFPICEFNEPSCSLITETIDGLSDPDDVLLADLDGDSVLDLVVSVDDPGLAILFGNIDGSFNDPVVVATPPFVSSIAVGDIDGDLDLDLLTENSVDSTITTLLNNGDGTFNTGTEILIFAPGFTFPSDLELADFDDDGDLDLVAAVGALGNGASSLYVYSNEGGEFLFEGTLSLQSYPTFIDCIDIDDDQDIDFIVNDIGTFPTAVSIYRNNGNGTFGSRLDLLTNGAESSPGESAGSGAFAIGDINDDSFLDIVVADRASNNLSILFSRFDGTFDPPVLCELGIYGAALAIEMIDVDNDSDLDLLIANGFANNVLLMLNDGFGSFVFDFGVHVGSQPRSIFSDDYDNDGVVESFITHGESDSIVIASIDCSNVLFGDVNLDGVVNLLDISPFVDRISTGTFQAEADINGDGEVNLLDVAGFVDVLIGG